LPGDREVCRDEQQGRSRRVHHPGHAACAELHEQRADDADEDHTREQPVDLVFLAADDADGAVGDDHEHRCADGQQGSDTVVMLRFDDHVAGVTWGNGRDERI